MLKTNAQGSEAGQPNVGQLVDLRAFMMRYKTLARQCLGCKCRFGYNLDFAQIKDAKPLASAGVAKFYKVGFAVFEHIDD